MATLLYAWIATCFEASTTVADLGVIAKRIKRKTAFATRCTLLHVVNRIIEAATRAKFAPPDWAQELLHTQTPSHC